MDIVALRAHAADLLSEVAQRPTPEAAQAAVEASRAVVASSPPDDLHPADAWMFARALFVSWDLGGEPAVFDDAIAMYRLVAMLPPFRENAVMAMVHAWRVRAERDPSRATLDAALAEVSAHADEFPEAADEEADLLVLRYTVAHRPSDLNEAITKLDARSRRAVTDLRTRSMLSSLLRTRYESFHREDDLVRALGLAVSVMLTADEQNDEEWRLQAGGLVMGCLRSLPDTAAAAALAVTVLCEALHEKGDRQFHQELVFVLVTKAYEESGKPSLLRMLFGLYTGTGYDDTRGLLAREIVLEWAGRRKDPRAPLELADEEVVLLLGLCVHAIRTHTTSGDLVGFLLGRLLLVASLWSGSGAALSTDTLKRVIETIEPVVDALPATHRKPVLATLSELHLKYLNRVEDPGDGRAFIEVNRRLAEDGDVLGLGGLANALLSNYRRAGDPADLDEAISILGRIGTRDYADALLLARALLTRFDRDQESADWFAAVRLMDQPEAPLPDNANIREGFGELVRRLVDVAATAVQSPDAEVVRRLCGMCERAMLVVGGKDLFDTLRYQLAVLRRELPEVEKQTPPPADDHAKWVLARSLAGTHGDNVPISDLDRAIRLLDEVLSTAQGRQFRAQVLNDLAGAHIARFAKAGDSADLDRSVTVMREVVRLKPDDALMLANLSHKLTERFEAFGSTADLTEALMHSEHARELLGDDASVAFFVHNGLAGLYRKRSVFTSDPADLDLALTALRAALDVLPGGHPDRAMAQHNLGSFLLYRTLHGQDSDPEEVVRLITSALEATPAGHPAEVSRRTSLAQALLHRSDTSSAHPDDQTDALRILREQLAAYGPDEPRRFGAAHVLAAALLNRRDSTAEAMRLLREVVRAPQAAAETRLTAGVRLAVLTEETAPPAEAIAVWDEVVRLLGAVAWQGLPRGDQERFLLQYQHHVARAATFAINAGDVRGALDLLEHGRSILWQQEGSAELDLGPSESAVVLIAHGGSGHAIIIGRDGVRAVELPGLVAPEIDRWCAVLDRATQALGVADRQAYDEAQQAAAAVLDRLWHAVVGPVLAALPEGRPRLFWCPVGQLAMLPWHAATDAGSGRSCLDVAVSSYVPGLRSLATALARRGSGQEIEEFLTIALDDHPDEKLALVHVKAEVATVERLLPGARHKALLNLQATRAAAAAELARHRFVHVSCHGAHDPNAPSASGLVLSDGVLTVLDIAEVRTDDAQFAYLSACRTAMGAAQLSDESIHLGAALFLAGFRQVVGTLWAVGDQLAAKVAEAFYRKVAASGPDAAAVAIGEVALMVRAQRKAEPLLWAGYVHIGV
ncbi:CHAT domain-containing protein [Lentzea sp. HUAS12]|uniref:CHAT domain-containing protein n=1 Tax=Lentzea sp. HUAS12 TaxID=2951806 RepID=UPI00209CDF87|nr:CHAT domain-containing protein [Lentzea sp. HUAS12]USX54344.1 CHAT domain-containing protein [Lentzea sp. HUAS12]